MPKELEECVEKLMADPDFKPEDGEDKKSAAYALCTARMEESNVQEEEKEMLENSQLIRKSLRFEASPVGDGGNEWKVRIINSGVSRNNRNYPLDVLHRDGAIFEGVPVHAGNGRDHSPEERGVKSIVGFIKNVERVPEGLDATFHVSDPILKDTLADLHQEGVLQNVVGFSIVAEGRWQHDLTSRSETAIQLVRADSVDLVREPAAGGKFLAVAESEEVLETEPLKEEKAMVDISEEKLQELLTEASSKAVQEFKDSVAPEQEAELVTAESVEVEDKTADKVSEALTQLNATLLTSALTNASLPDIAEQRIRTQFEGKEFDANAVQSAIAGEKDYLASLTKVAVENVTKETGKVTTDEGDKKLARLDASFTPSRTTTLDSGEKVKGYRTFTEAYCDWTGKNPLHIGREEVWEAWMNGSKGYASWREESVERLYSEALTTSNWGEVSADRMHKALLRNYADLPQYNDWRKVAKVVSVNDYQAHRDIKVGGFSDLAVVAERGTYPELTMPTDEETTITMQKRGGIATQITRELILNDNIGAIAEIPRELARSAARTLYKAVMDELAEGDTNTYGPDSTAIFAGGHNNTGTTALSLSGIDAANLAMRSQTKYGSTNDVLGAANTPRFLVVPNELQGLAERLVSPSAQVITQITADTDTDQDIRRFAGTMEVITVDYWTDANEYFLVASPDEVAGITVAFLNGNEEPELFIQQDETVGETFTMDVQNIKVRQEFATTVSDFRGMYRQNPS